ITAHFQPFAIPAATPAETDEHLLARARRVMLGRHIVRRSDLEKLVRDLVPGVAAAKCIETSWTQERNGWLKSISGVRVALRPTADAQSVRVQAATERFLRAHLPVAL